jgi:prevent-host-death family protein
MAKEISALELRKHFGEVMEEVRYRREPCIVKRNGRAIIVLLDIETYNGAKEELEEEAFLEEYTKERIAEFLREDQLNSETLKKARQKLES